jgi:hypothetical protein
MARDFASGTDRINFGSPSALDNLSAISVSAIIKADTFSNTNQGFFPRFVSKESGWGFAVSNTIGQVGRLAFFVAYSTTGLNVEGQTSQLNTTDTFVICVTWDGSTNATTGVKLYINGSESASYQLRTNAVGTRTDDAASNLVIGNRNAADRAFDGQMAEVAIWDVALTADEVAQLGDRMKPMRVRPQSLKFYSPLVRELIDVRGGLTGTATGTSVDVHPRVY